MSSSKPRDLPQVWCPHCQRPHIVNSVHFCPTETVRDDGYMMSHPYIPMDFRPVPLTWPQTIVTDDDEP